VAVEIAERYADGLASDDELQAAWVDARWAHKQAVFTPGADGPAWAACRATFKDDLWGIWDSLTGGRLEQDQDEATLLRDVTGNPFRSVTLDPAWTTPAVVQLARSLYEERRFEDMPVLANALEETGCQDAMVLEHCRGLGPHVRGCWVLDVILGRSDVIGQEWLEVTDPDKMLEIVFHFTSRRKVQLFHCAGLRRLWHHLTPPERSMLDFWEGLIEKVTDSANEGDKYVPLVHLFGDRAKLQVLFKKVDEQRIRSGFLRDIIGNPFRIFTFDSTWKTQTVVQLSQSIYDERRFEDMPVLADALEEAGCQDATVLEHCRGPGPHVRGCWVVDLILGKE
jgi:hypothetical protein